jgi:hypothetical protein
MADPHQFANDAIPVGNYPMEVAMVMTGLKRLQYVSS